MDDIAYYIFRFFRKPVLFVAGVLVFVGIAYGLVIGDVGKGFNTIYMQPAQVFSGWVFEHIRERAERKTERLMNSMEQ